MADDRVGVNRRSPVRDRTARGSRRISDALRRVDGAQVWCRDGGNLWFGETPLRQASVLRQRFRNEPRVGRNVSVTDGFGNATSTACQEGCAGSNVCGAAMVRSPCRTVCGSPSVASGRSGWDSSAVAEWVRRQERRSACSASGMYDGWGGGPTAPAASRTRSVGSQEHRLQRCRGGGYRACCARASPMNVRASCFTELGGCLAGEQHLGDRQRHLTNGLR